MKWPLTSCVANEISSTVGGESEVEDLNAAARIASSESQGCSLEGGVSSVRRSDPSPKASSASAMMMYTDSSVYL